MDCDYHSGRCRSEFFILTPLPRPILISRHVSLSSSSGTTDFRRCSKWIRDFSSAEPYCGVNL